MNDCKWWETYIYNEKVGSYLISNNKIKNAVEEIKKLKEENARLREEIVEQSKGSCFHCEEVALMNIKLEEENARLREALTGLLYHCEDYGLKEESFAILMASNKARKALERGE